MSYEAELVQKAATAIQDSAAILVTAGAGMGVDSGLPDFRGQEGFWRAYPAIAQMGISFEQMANPDWFDRDPRLAWAFYGHRLNLYRQTIPHVGFQHLLEIGRSKPYGYRVLTSNVDGQFHKAGFEDLKVSECHGSIHHLQCTQDCRAGIWSADSLHVEVEEDSFQAVGDLPRCHRCGALARPNILMFGDWGWSSDRTSGQESRLRSWLGRLQDEQARLVIVEIGAGQSVPTIRMSSERYADLHSAVLVRINPRDHHVPNQKHVSLAADGLDGIRAIYDQL